MTFRVIEKVVQSPVKGEPGYKGKPGIQGSKGDIGASGDTGSAGPKVWNGLYEMDYMKWIIWNGLFGIDYSNSIVYCIWNPNKMVYIILMVIWNQLIMK